MAKKKKAIKKTKQQQQKKPHIAHWQKHLCLANTGTTENVTGSVAV